MSPCISSNLLPGFDYYHHQHYNNHHYIYHNDGPHEYDNHHNIDDDPRTMCIELSDPMQQYPGMLQRSTCAWFLLQNMAKSTGMFWNILSGQNTNNDMLSTQ